MKERRNSLATSEIEKEFADLRELFEKIFCIPVTSERVFSKSESCSHTVLCSHGQQAIHVLGGLSELVMIKSNIKPQPV